MKSIEKWEKERKEEERIMKEREKSHGIRA
jgi:hypothetical protein